MKVLKLRMLLLLQLLDAMNQDSGIPLTSLKVDGGMTANSLLMQIQADLLGIPVGRVVLLLTKDDVFTHYIEVSISYVLKKYSNMT
jgi:hypothetical protein